MAPTIVTANPSRIHTVPRPMMIIQCHRDHGSRSIRAGMSVSIVRSETGSALTLATALPPSCNPCVRRVSQGRIGTNARAVGSGHGGARADTALRGRPLLRGPALARRPLVRLGLLRPGRLRRGGGRELGGTHAGRGAALRARLAAGRVAARRVDARPPAAAALAGR